MSGCQICPRRCLADRENGRQGLCGAGSQITAARAALHFWEEPCISGDHKHGAEERGSGAIFFCGCPLGCVYCQNYKISRGTVSLQGTEISSGRLADIMLRLESQGAYNINLVSPTQYTLQIIKALEKVRPRLSIPVIWNTGGYELISTLEKLDGLVDVWLPDVKYFSPGISEKYSRADDYFEYASKAALWMYDNAGPVVFGDGGMIKRGLIIRHMVIPSHRKDSMDIVRWIADSFDHDSIRVSLMSQYTPTGKTENMPELNRKVTTFEYDSVIRLADGLGLKGWTQSRDSSSRSFTPDFDNTGIDA